MIKWVLLTLAVLLAAFGALFWWATANASVGTLDRVDGLFTGGDATLVQGAVQYGPADEQVLFVHRPGGADAATPLPVLVFIHGGSWRDGDPADYGFVARNLAPEGFVVVLAGYRKEERGQYPAMLEDAAGTLRWIVDNIGQAGGDPSRIYLMGHSAGAYNAVQLALDPQWLTLAGLPQDTVDGVIGLAGPYDFLPLDSDATRLTFGSHTPLEETQPINAVRPDAPPMLLLHGSEDTVVYPRNSTDLTAALIDAGSPAEAVEFTGMDHIAILTTLARPFDRDPRVKEAVTTWLKEREEDRVDAAGSPASAGVQPPAP